MERDELLTAVEALRGKLNKAITVEQEMEARREQASENISQVSKMQTTLYGRPLMYFMLDVIETNEETTKGVNDLIKEETDFAQKKRR